MPPPFQISEYATGRTYMWYVCLSEKDTPSTYNLWQRSLRRILRSADNNIITKNFFYTECCLPTFTRGITVCMCIVLYDVCM